MLFITAVIASTDSIHLVSFVSTGWVLALPVSMPPVLNLLKPPPSGWHHISIGFDGSLESRQDLVKPSEPDLRDGMRRFLVSLAKWGHPPNL